MADTENAAAAATNPAEVPKTESSVEVTSDSKVEKTQVTPDSKPEEKTAGEGDSKDKSDDAGEEKWELNGKSKEREGRRHDHNDRNARNDRHDRNGRQDRSDNRRDGGRGRGRGRGGFQNHNKRRNTEFESLPESDDPVEIRGQVEFYFSSQNLATDEHLFLELDGPNNRPVSIKHVHTFKRMRRFTPYSAVVDALRESKDLIVVDDGDYSREGNEAVKRKEPLVVAAKDGDDKSPPSTIDLFYRLKTASSNNLETSVYVKGFGLEDDAGQIALEQFFRPYGAVMVRKRRDDDNSWKGSIFVEFDTEDSQKQFLALDPKPKFNNNELTTMGKEDYVIMKCKEKGIKPDWELTEQERYELRKKHREENGGGYRGRGGGRGRGRGGRGGRGGQDRRDNGRDRRDHHRSRSPRRRRDRSASSGSVDSRDWNTRRDRYQNGKSDRGSRKEDKKEIERDAYGVPVVKDSRTEAEIAASANKRKADDENREASPKKSKLEIKQDE